MRKIALPLVAGVLIATSAAAEEVPVRLKQAPGVEKVEANCGLCHSLDYIQMNSPYLSSAGWDSEITKMINAFGAPIDPADVKIIGEYLKQNYGEAADRAANPAGPAAPAQKKGDTSAPLRKGANLGSKINLAPSPHGKSSTYLYAGRPTTAPAAKTAAFANASTKVATPNPCWSSDHGHFIFVCDRGGGGEGGGGGGGGEGGGDGSGM